MQTFDLIIIGGGPAGYVAAIRASQLGMKTAVVEKQKMGGMCLNWGCIPSKTMLASAEAYVKTRNLKKLGIYVEGEVGFNWNQIVQRKSRVVQTLRNGVKFLLRFRRCCDCHHLL